MGDRETYHSTSQDQHIGVVSVHLFFEQVVGAREQLVQKLIIYYDFERRFPNPTPLVLSSKLIHMSRCFSSSLFDHTPECP